MIGPSAEQLSAAVQWFCWGYNTAVLFDDVLECISFTNLLHYLNVNVFFNNIPHFSHSMFLSCSDNGLPVPQVARR